MGCVCDREQKSPQRPPQRVSPEQLTSQEGPHEDASQGAEQRVLWWRGLPRAQSMSRSAPCRGTRPGWPRAFCLGSDGWGHGGEAPAALGITQGRPQPQPDTWPGREHLGDV